MRGDAHALALAAVVRRMAHREAAMLLQNPLRAAYVDEPPVRVVIVPRPCPWCGRATVPAAPHGRLTPLREVRIVPEGSPGPGQVLLSALACEQLPARPLLLLVKGAERGVGLPASSFTTRGAALARLVHEEAMAIEKAIEEIDWREGWVDSLVGLASPGGPEPDRVLPAAARLCPDEASEVDITALRQLRARLRPHFLTPHLDGPLLDGLNDDYLRWRASFIRAGMG